MNARPSYQLHSHPLVLVIMLTAVLLNKLILVVQLLLPCYYLGICSTRLILVS